MVTVLPITLVVMVGMITGPWK